MALMARRLSAVEPAATVTLRPMKSDEFEAFAERSVRRYAADNVEAGRATAATALDDARRELAALLPAGQATPGHHFWQVHDDDILVGYLWLAEGAEAAYVFDVMILEDLRGLGYGRRTMQAAHRAAADAGAGRIELNVFDHNVTARTLYERLGYEEVPETG